MTGRQHDMNAASDFAMKALIERVRAAAETGTVLRIRGGGTKDFYGGAPVGEVLDVAPLQGIITYEPSELVITAKAGTLISELEAVLAEQHQYLPFEPPRFGKASTVGGMVAAGLSGPGRASAGALRDFVLGTSLVNGRAELLTFGGQVMKNVAGYDVSRVLCGSLGILGVIASVSLKVLPIPVADLTLAFECSESSALEILNTWAGRPMPLNASIWTNAGGSELLYVRLRGAHAAVSATAQSLGGTHVATAAAELLWRGVRDHTQHWFVDAPHDHDLWRLSVPQTTPVLSLPAAHYTEWHGGLRWYYLQRDQQKMIRDMARCAGGHATLFKAATSTNIHERAAQSFDSLSPTLMRIHTRLKQEFDPRGIFNRGRLYSEM